LLNALAHSAPPRAPQSAPAPHRKMVWFGAALLLVGFFLPWFVIKAGIFQKELDSLIGQFPMVPMIQGTPSPDAIRTEAMFGAPIYVAGGDVSHGLGWCVLLLGLLAAALPFVAANLDSQTCQKVSLIALSIGAIILLYLVTEEIRFAGEGLALGLAGYALEFVGVLKARRLDWLHAL